MTTVTESDLKELKDLIAALIQENREQFANLKKDVTDLKKDVTDLKKDVTDLKKDVTDLKISSSKVEGTLSAQATLTQKIPDLIEKVGELKNWKQIAIVTVTAVISGIITWFVRSNNLTL
jgi:chromosome segregation ATPase